MSQSNNDSATLLANENYDDSLVEDVAHRGPVRRGLEIAATVLSIGGFIAALAATLYVVTANNLQSKSGQGQGIPFSTLVRYIPVIGGQSGNAMVMLPLAAMIVIGVTRALWRGESARGRSVVAATLAILVALYNLIIGLIIFINTLADMFKSPAKDPMHGQVNGQLGDSSSAYLTTLMSPLLMILLSALTVGLGVLFAFGKDRGVNSEVANNSALADSTLSGDEFGSTKSSTPVADSTAVAETTTERSVSEAAADVKTDEV